MALRKAVKNQVVFLIATFDVYQKTAQQSVLRTELYEAIINRGFGPPQSLQRPY